MESVNLLKTINHIARDSQGRTYNENRRLVATAFEDVPPLQTFHICDPVKGEYPPNPYTFVARQIALISAPPARRDTVPVQAQPPRTRSRAKISGPRRLKTSSSRVFANPRMMG